MLKILPEKGACSVPRDSELAPAIGSHRSFFSNPVLVPLTRDNAGHVEDRQMKQT